jgi:hypothetical protein
MALALSVSDHSEELESYALTSGSLDSVSEAVFMVIIRGRKTDLELFLRTFIFIDAKVFAFD